RTRARVPAVPPRPLRGVQPGLRPRHAVRPAVGRAHGIHPDEPAAAGALRVRLPARGWIAGSAAGGVPAAARLGVAPVSGFGPETRGTQATDIGDAAHGDARAVDGISLRYGGLDAATAF